MNYTCIRNSLGRLVPQMIPGIGTLEPFSGAYARLDGSYEWTPSPFVHKVPSISTNKIAPDLRAAIERSGLQNGLTISFHIHLMEWRRDRQPGARGA